MALGDQRYACKLNKAAFFRDVGYTPHRGQIPIHASTAPRRIVVCGVRFGKSVCAAMEGLAAAMEPATRSMGWVVAPTYDLADKVFREIVFVAHDKLPARVIKVQESAKVLQLRNAAGGVSEIRAKSADNPVSLLGEGLDWLVVDEAARLKPNIWEGYLSQRLIDKKGWALLISTPKGKGFFFDLYRAGLRDDPQYESWNCPSATNPHLDAELIEGERLRLPERVFRQEYMAEFLEGAGAVFRRVREAATGKWRELEADSREPASKPACQRHVGPVHARLGRKTVRGEQADVARPVAVLACGQPGEEDGERDRQGGDHVEGIGACELALPMGRRVQRHRGASSSILGRRRETAWREDANRCAGQSAFTLVVAWAPRPLESRPSILHDGEPLFGPCKLANRYVPMERLISLAITTIAGLMIIGTGQVFTALREIALNTRAAVSKKADRDHDSTSYVGLKTIASVYTLAGLVVILVGMYVALKGEDLFSSGSPPLLTR